MPTTSRKNADQPREIQRPPAEALFSEELRRLEQEEGNAPKPLGWKLTPRSVLKFVLGDEAEGIAPKFVGSRAFVERCIVALATNRGLMLIGEPGTAKSYLSELLAAAVSGDSTLTVQGSAGTTEDGIKYSWNYALLLAEGPTERAMVSAPVHRGMREGKIVRFEEITRCPLEIQDTLLSVLSDRVLAIPELPDPSARMLFARSGFNIIATANTRDRGVNEMSAALKRRFNFETVPAISEIKRELELVQRETGRLLAQANIPIALPSELAKVLVTTFHELRRGRTSEGNTLDPLTTVMSTAEAVSTGYAAVMHAYYYDEGRITADHLVHGMIGSAFKDAQEDRQRLQHYFEHIVAKRHEPEWRALHEARRLL